MNDFEVTSTNDFVEEIIKVVEKELTISKIEEDSFRYTRLDINVVSDGIEISMEAYAKSLQSLVDIRQVDDRNEVLNKEEMKLQHKMTEKIACSLTPQGRIFVIKH